jgi:hypothetical protein
MNDESSNVSSAPKQVSFNESVQMIYDSAIEYVDLPPVIIETLNESDSIMSFTELTESSDQYYNENPHMQVTNFGETSMSFSDLYNGSDDPIVAQDVPAAVLPPPNRSDSGNPPDDDDDGPTQESTPSSFWMRHFGALATIAGAVRLLAHWFTSNQLPADSDDTNAIAMAAAGTTNKGFLIPSIFGNGGSTYISYVDSCCLKVKQHLKLHHLLINY